MNALQLCRWQFSHKRNFVADFVEAKCDFRLKNGSFEFLSPLEGLEATYDVHLRLIGKRVVDFPVSVNCTFLGSCYGWGGTSEYRLKNRRFCSKGVSLDQNCRYTIHAFDRRSDRQTDSFLVARPRCMLCNQRGKKMKSCNLSTTFYEDILLFALFAFFY